MKTVGLIAGTQKLPLLFAKQAKKNGFRVVAVNFLENPNRALASQVDALACHSIGQLGKTIDFFKSHGVSSIVMQGQVAHKNLYKKIRPDIKAAAVLLKIAMAPKGTEGLLKAVASFLQKNGLQLKPATWLMEPWLAKAGVMGKVKPSKALKKEFEYGEKLVRGIGTLDIGQTVLVKGLSAVAVESIEGTDAAILRAGKLAGKGLVMVKRARPHQDMRFDVPVVGPQTFKNLAKVGAAGVALEAGKSLIIELESCIKIADQAKMVVFSH